MFLPLQKLLAAKHLSRRPLRVVVVARKPVGVVSLLLPRSRSRHRKIQSASNPRFAPSIKQNSTHSFVHGTHIQQSSSPALHTTATPASPQRTQVAQHAFMRPRANHPSLHTQQSAHTFLQILAAAARVTAGAGCQGWDKNPQPDKLMGGVEQLVDEHDIEKVASANQLSADDVAAGELSLDCNRFLIGRSMINDRVSDHEEGITWLRSAPRLLWVARERRAEADAAERQRRQEK
ncbi:unnamed protein product [Closterium sp. NIES-65]|nr:unnamed protein product [Closterium sp. NIES-65]